MAGWIDRLTGHKSTHYSKQGASAAQFKAELDALKEKRATADAMSKHIAGMDAEVRKTKEDYRYPTEGMSDRYKALHGASGASFGMWQGMGPEGSKTKPKAGLGGSVSLDRSDPFYDGLTPEERQEAVREAMSRMAKMAQMDMQVNDLADKTRMGGKFTYSGLQESEKNANLNAMDRMRTKAQLMPFGLGGTDPRLSMGGN